MLLLQNATLIDGTGAPPWLGNLLIDGDRIASLGNADPADAAKIDCTGLAAAPGFIDIHSHSDLQVLENDRAKADQGVTTEVVGNCGFSPYPFLNDPFTKGRSALHEFAGGILFGSETDWGWQSAGEYIEEIHRRARLSNVLSLTGHGSLRIAHMGHRQGPPEPKEMDAMERALAECFSEGSCGLSTGLMYAPGSSAPREELIRLCRVVAKHGKVYTTHMRSYSHDLLESIEEQIDLARESGCRLQISHLQTVGRANWEKQARALELLERARLEGIDVEFDSYPYLAGSTVLTQLLPQRAMDGGIAQLLNLLADPAERQAIARATTAGMAQEWSDIFVASVGSERNRSLAGRSFAEIAAEREIAAIDAALDLLIEERGIVNILSFNQSDENLERLLTHPLCTVISDGFYVKGRPHPRLYGTFPFLLGEISRRRGWLTISEAVHKITAKPAARFDLKDRGRLAAGFVADIVLFDPVLVEGRASYEDPKVPPEGIAMVFRGGRQITPNTRSMNHVD